MKRFLIEILLFFLCPLIGLTILYFVTDPYKTIKPFSLEYFDTANRDYLSSELFLMNEPEQQYNAFVFASSRGGGINTYHWKKYLPENAHPFLFQAWAETITGIEQKITYIYEHDIPLDYALVLLDITGTFTNNQNPRNAIALKNPRITGQPGWEHQMILLYDFLQKPSQWKEAVKNRIPPTKPKVLFDPISNDWDGRNKNVDISIPPEKDSLNNMSRRTKTTFFMEIHDKTDDDLKSYQPLIDDHFAKQFENIRSMFEAKETDYRIIITPGYCYTSYAISQEDLDFLRTVFGSDKVYDFSKKNLLNSDYNNFSDPNHFGLYVGWHIIEDIYNPDYSFEKAGR